MRDPRRPQRPRPAVDPGRLPAVARVVLAVLALGLGAAAVATRATSLRPSDLVRNDFIQDYAAARAAADGLDPYGDLTVLTPRYTGVPYPEAPVLLRDSHPPPQILMLKPLSRLSFRSARMAWVAATAALVAAALALVAWELGWSLGVAVCFGIGALALPMSQKELLYGNSTGVILFLLALGWFLLRRDRARAAAVVLGVAAAVKLFPLFMVLVFVRRRRLDLAALQVGVAAAVVLGASLALTGALSGVFLEVSSFNFRFWRSAPMNFSVVGIPYRWLTTSYWNPGAPDLPILAGALALAAQVACAGVAFRVRPGLSRDEFWTVMPWMTLATPLAWEYSGIVVLPLILAMLARGWLVSGPGPRIAAMVGGAFVSLAVLPVLPEPVSGISAGLQVTGYSLPLYGLILLGLADLMTPPGASTGSSPKRRATDASTTNV